MNTFFTHYGIFFAETITLVVAILVSLVGILAIINKGKMKGKERIEITKLNEKYEELRVTLQQETCNKAELKSIKAQEKLKAKQEKAAQKKNKKKKTTATSIIEKPRRRIFIIDFNGDIRASEVENLRQEVTSILTIATPKDEVVVKIDSAGGLVHGYGLAASQLKRIRDRNIPLTAIVDKIAASGGYMMACVADRILAAPFAIIGSIGVISQLPNFNRFLKKHDIDFEQISAGEYKRTLTLFGENTNKGRKKLQQEIEEAHELFKSFVATHRSSVNINAIATGEHWFGIRAKELRLIDDIITSDDYLLEASDKADLYEIDYVVKKPFMEKISTSIHKTATKLLSVV